MLYWATYFDKIHYTVIEELLTLTEAYPEGPVYGGEFTPIHAACRSKDPKKLQILLEDYYDRNRYKVFEDE